MRFFKFKQFQLTDDRSSMKVGTDSVLLGSWVNVSKTKSVLDIGCGSGLISLMLAQRISDVKIVGVEIDEGSFLDALQNVDASAWKNQIKILHSDIRNENTANSYDLVISNPPFFKESLLPLNSNRAMARHDEQLSLNDLLKVVDDKICNTGLFAIVFPYDREKELLQLAKEITLYPKRILRTRNKPEAVIKRSFIEFTNNSYDDIEYSELTIRNKNNEYSDEYKLLTKDFYLKF